MVFDLAVITQLEYMERLLDRIDGGAGDLGAAWVLRDCQTGFLSQWLEDGGRSFAHLDEYKSLRRHHEEFIHCVTWVMQDLRLGPSPGRRLLLRHAIQDASAAIIGSLWKLKAKVHLAGAHQELPCLTS